GRGWISDLETLVFELRDSESRRGAVGLGKHDVETDGRRTVGRHAVYERGDHGARPRPLPEPADALVIDVDDGDRALGSRARQQLLIGVEDEIVQPVQRAERRKRSADDDGYDEQPGRPNGEMAPA